jgi:hypothetical protein
MLFADLISGYSHWAYADMDTLLGRLPMMITPRHLNRFDVITVSFGDNNRLYMRGQLTILRNNEKVNSLWMQCEHLLHVGARLDRLFNQSKDRVWFFQSAEGCFSHVVMRDPSLKVLIATSQVSDAEIVGWRDRESFLLGGAIVRCHENPFNASDISSIQAFFRPFNRYDHDRLVLVTFPYAR